MSLFEIQSDEILLIIFKWLNQYDLVSLSRTSKKFNQAAFWEELWKDKIVVVRPVYPDVKNHPIFKSGCSFNIDYLNCFDLRLIDQLRGRATMPIFTKRYCFKCKQSKSFHRCNSCQKLFCDCLWDLNLAMCTSCRKNKLYQCSYCDSFQLKEDRIICSVCKYSGCEDCLIKVNTNYVCENCCSNCSHCGETRKYIHLKKCDHCLENVCRKCIPGETCSRCVLDNV